MATDKTYEDNVKSMITSLLTSTPLSCTIKRLAMDYQEMIGEEIPYRKMGYNSLEHYLRSIPDTVRVCGTGAFAEVKIVVNEKIAHINDLVMRQKTTVPKNKRYPLSRRTPVPAFVPGRSSDRPRSPSKKIRYPKPSNTKEVRPIQVNWDPNKNRELKQQIQQHQNIQNERMAYAHVNYSANVHNEKMAHAYANMFSNIQNERMAYANASFSSNRQNVRMPQSYANIFPNLQNERMAAAYAKFSSHLENERIATAQNERMAAAYANLSSNIQINQLSKKTDQYSIRNTQETVCYKKPSTLIINSETSSSQTHNNCVDVKSSPEHNFCKNSNIHEEVSPSSQDLNLHKKLTTPIIKKLNSHKQDASIPSSSEIKNSNIKINSDSNECKFISEKLTKLPESVHIGLDVEGSKIIDADQMRIPRQIQNNLKELILTHPDGIWCAQLPDLYRAHFKKKLIYDEYGYRSLINFCMDLPEIFHCVRPSKGDFKLFDKNRELPKEAQESFVLATYNVKSVDLEKPLPNLEYTGFMEYLPDDVVLDEEIPRQFLPEDTREGAYIDIVVAEIFDLSKFWIFLDENGLDELMDDLQVFYGSDDNYLIPSVLLKEGLYCVCKFFSEYHRAVVLKVFDSEVKMCFIDYGTVCKVPKEGIYFLTRKFAELPFQAIRCRLANLYPLDENTTWSRRDVEIFNSLIRERSICAQINNILSEDILDLYLFDRNTGQNINDQLVKAGVALYTTQERKNLSTDLGYSPKVKYLHLFPTFKELEFGMVPSTADLLILRQLAVSYEQCYPHYFNLKTDVHLFKEVDKKHEAFIEVTIERYRKTTLFPNLLPCDLEEVQTFSVMNLFMFGNIQDQIKSIALNRRHSRVKKSLARSRDKKHNKYQERSLEFFTTSQAIQTDNYDENTFDPENDFNNSPCYELDKTYCDNDESNENTEHYFDTYIERLESEEKTSKWLQFQSGRDFENVHNPNAAIDNFIYFEKNESDFSGLSSKNGTISPDRSAESYQAGNIADSYNYEVDSKDLSVKKDIESGFETSDSLNEICDTSSSKESTSMSSIQLTEKIVITKQNNEEVDESTNESTILLTSDTSVTNSCKSSTNVNLVQSSEKIVNNEQKDEERDEKKKCSASNVDIAKNENVLETDSTSVKIEKIVCNTLDTRNKDELAAEISTNIKTQQNLSTEMNISGFNTTQKYDENSSNSSVSEIRWSTGDIQPEQPLDNIDPYRGIQHQGAVFYPGPSGGYSIPFQQQRSMRPPPGFPPLPNASREIAFPTGFPGGFPPGYPAGCPIPNNYQGNIFYPQIPFSYPGNPVYFLNNPTLYINNGQPDVYTLYNQQIMPTYQTKSSDEKP